MEFALGVLTGASIVCLWTGRWFVGENLVDQLLAEDFNEHAEQAIAVSQQREVGR